MIKGWYTLKLTCGVQGCSAALYLTERDVGPARTLARAEGWTLRITADQCYCPDHKQSSTGRI